MEKLTTKCSNCFCIIRYPDTSEGRVIKCPKCQVETKLISNAPQISPAKMPELMKPSEPKIIQPPSIVIEGKAASKEFPQRMKASKALAGTPCTICGISIDLGDDVYNCKVCNNSTMHIACYETNQACGNIGCEKALVEIKPNKTETTTNNDAGGTTDEMKECAYCGEKIKALSKKCRFCGEFLDRKLKYLNDQKKKNNEADEKLEVWEIIFSILCGCIACIVGIVYVVQGKKKGWKMIGIVAIASVIWAIISGMR